MTPHQPIQRKKVPSTCTAIVSIAIVSIAIVSIAIVSIAIQVQAAWSTSTSVRIRL